MSRKKEIYNTLGKRVKKARKQMGMSQEELSLMTGIHSVHISRIERDEANPGADIVTELSYALNVSTDYLLRGETVHGVKVGHEELAELLKSMTFSEQEAMYRLYTGVAGLAGHMTAFNKKGKNTF